MADLKISQLPNATTPLAGTEVLPIVQSNATKQVSISNLTAGRSVSVANATLATGNLVIGTSGKGIDFSANGGNVVSQIGGSLTVASGVTATLFTPESSTGYLVYVAPATGDSNSSGACLVISRYGTSLPVLATLGATGLTFNASGGALQITNATPYEYTYDWVATKLIH